MKAFIKAKGQLMQVQLELRMSSWTPSIVPKGDDETVYLVVDDFGNLGRCWRETDTESTDLETVIGDILGGQYGNPVRVVGFNTAEGWSRDVSKDVAHELRRRSDLQMKELSRGLEDFIRRYETGDREQLTLRLV
jgi:hypothetical protein